LRGSVLNGNQRDQWITSGWKSTADDLAQPQVVVSALYGSGMSAVLMGFDKQTLSHAPAENSTSVEEPTFVGSVEFPREPFQIAPRSSGLILWKYAVRYDNFRSIAERQELSVQLRKAGELELELAGATAAYRIAVTAKLI
jgi:hypothetical protein